MMFLLENRILVLLLSVLLSLFTIVYFLIRGRKTPLLYSYTICQGMIFLWSGAYMMELLAVERHNKWVFLLIEYIPICFIIPCWLVFCLYYSEYIRDIKKWVIYTLFIIPSIFYLMVFTNDYHHLFYSTFELEYHTQGVLFLAHALLQYIYALIGTVVLMKYASKQTGYGRKQSLLLVFAFVVPLVSNFFYITGIVKTSYDPTPPSFSISLMLFSIATFRYRFLNIVPLALSKTFDSMKEAVLVVDSLNRVTAFNRSFTDTFQFADVSYDDHVEGFIRHFKQQSNSLPENEYVLDMILNPIRSDVSGELLLSEPVKAYFSVGIRPIKNRKGLVLGKVISFNDITRYNNLLEELSARNNTLSDLNRQLESHAATVEELTIVKERNRFARDAHDTIGHTMTVLISLLEVSKITLKDDPGKAEEKIYEAVDIAKKGLNELRCSVRGLMTDKFHKASLVDSLHNVIQSFKSSCEDIEFSVDGIEPSLQPEQIEAVFRTCQEALTNSIRHGKARHINVILRFTREKIRLFVIDDGCGCGKIDKGVGLTGMEQRASALNGTIVYGSDGESGFNIRLEIPLEVGR